MLLMYFFWFIIFVSVSLPIYLYTHRDKWIYTKKMKRLLNVRLFSGAAIFLCLLINRFILMDESVMEGSFLCFLLLIFFLVCLILSDYWQLVRVKKGISENLEKQNYKSTRECGERQDESLETDYKVLEEMEGDVF